MKKMIVALSVTLMSAQSFSAEYRIQKVKELGPMKNEVIFQSSDLKKIKKSKALKGKVVVKWGLHVYEVLNGYYTCNKNNFCKLTDFERVASFEKCVVKKKVAVECKNRLSGSSIRDTSSDVVIYENPDFVQEEFTSRAGSNVDSTYEVIRIQNPDTVQDDFSGRDIYPVEYF